MDAFYQTVRWLDAKATALDAPAYSESIHSKLRTLGHVRQVLDCGTGVGHSVGIIAGLLSFDRLLAFDRDPKLVAEAQRRHSSATNVSFEVADLYRLPQDAAWMGFDLVVGQALLEHTNVTTSLPILRGHCRPGGWLYFPHNYFAPTIFEPQVSAGVDRQIEENFNRYTIEAQRSGDAVRSSRRLRNSDSRFAARLPSTSSNRSPVLATLSSCIPPVLSRPHYCQ